MATKAEIERIFSSKNIKRLAKKVRKRIHRMQKLQSKFDKLYSKPW